MQEYGTEKIIQIKKNRMICGVCGGIGEYFNIDATLIRLALVLLAAPAVEFWHISWQQLLFRTIRKSKRTEMTEWKIRSEE